MQTVKGGSWMGIFFIDVKIINFLSHLGIIYVVYDWKFNVLLSQIRAGQSYFWKGKSLWHRFVNFSTYWLVIFVRSSNYCNI